MGLWTIPQYTAAMLSKSFYILLIGITSLFLASARADPNPAGWEKWKTDFTQYSINLSEIMSGGPPKDGIPSIDQPKFESVENFTDIDPLEPVIGLEINGDARAYPLSVLMWHEIANDVVGGKAVTVTFCPLCNAAIVFDANIDGKAHKFGTTGRLRNSDLLMYDRQTESWWQQFSGEGIIGEYTGKRLNILPSRLESFEKFKERFPDGKVLVPNNPKFRDYGRNPYEGYDQLARPWLYGGPLPEGIPAMARVIVVRRDVREPIVLSLASLRETGEREIDGFRFLWETGQRTALGDGRISNGRDVGNVVVSHASSDETIDVAYDVTFAFVAHAFHPDVEIIK